MKYIDLDFFQPERDRIALKRKKMIPLIILVVILIGIIGLIANLYFSEKALETRLLEITEENLRIQAEITAYDKNIEDIENTLKRYEEGANGQDPFGVTGGESINNIREAHLNAILGSTPKEAFYSKILIADNLLTLEGYTDSTQVVAKIVYNLEQTGYFEKVLISKIATNDDSGYEFTINANIKE